MDCLITRYYKVIQELRQYDVGTKLDRGMEQNREFRNLFAYIYSYLMYDKSGTAV